MKRPLIFPAMAMALLVLRGTRTPGAAQALDIGAWALDAAVVVFTFFVVQRSADWARAGAAVACLSLLVVPPSPGAWLAWMPDIIPATLTLAFIALLYARDAEGRTVHWRDPRLAVPLLFLGLTPGVLLLAHRVLPRRWSDAFELDAAMGPLLAGVTVAFPVAVAALAMRIAARERKAATGDQGEPVPEWRRVAEDA